MRTAFLSSYENIFLIFSLIRRDFFFFALVYIKWLIVDIAQTTISLQKLVLEK